MTLPAPTYDLVLLLDAEADAQAHERILGEARAAIEAQGELLRDDEWGDRALSFPIAHKATARYHLLQFHVAAPELLEKLDRSLRIADEVVRFRIVKLKPGTPEAPRTLAIAGEAGSAGAEAGSAGAETGSAGAETGSAGAETGSAGAETGSAGAETGGAAEETPAAAPAEAVAEPALVAEPEPEAAQPA
jgi:small subunit ribosomal protein S6